MRTTSEKSIKVLRKIKKKGKIKRFAVVDTETWGLGGELAFGVIYINDNKNWTFYDKEHFYKIMKLNKIKHIYAHNLDFDAVKIRGISSVENTTNLIYTGGLLLKFTDEEGINWYDSYCLLKSSVDALGVAIGLKKLETPKKFIDPPAENYRTVSKKDINYCKRDCKIIKNYLDTAFELIGAQKLTIASAAMYIFRRKFLKSDLVVNSLHTKFKESYYGGRVEAFKLGNVNAKVVDINSMYPAVMRDIVFPHPGHLRTYNNVTKEEFLTYLKRYEGVAKVKISHPKTKIGLLPYRHKKLYFPAGNFTGSWNFNELRFALLHGCKILEVYEVTYSKVKLFNFFTEFVTTFYTLRKQETGAKQLFYKFILNSLYGKFAENTHTERVYLHASKLNKFIKELLTKNCTFTVHELKRDYFYIDYAKEIEDVPIHQIYLLSSYITSAARVKLAKSLIKNSDSVVYCDTDSMALEKPFKGVISKKLGGWDYENYTINKIIGNKFYKTDKELKVKGVPKSAKIKGKHFHYTHLIKSRESIRRGKKAGSTEQIKKKITFKYDKRIRLKNGDTEIITINE